MSVESKPKQRAIFPYRIVMEPRLEVVPRWMPPLVSLGAIVVALIIGGVILAIVGGNPFLTYVYSYPHKTAHRPIRPAIPLTDVSVASADALSLGTLFTKALSETLGTYTDRNALVAGIDAFDGTYEASTLPTAM